MSVEVSFAVGPAVGVLVATQVSTRVALVGIGVSMLLAGLVLYLLNPPIRSEAEARAAIGGEGLRRRTWLGSRMATVLVASAAAAIVLSGTDVSIVATLRHSGELTWTGLVIAAWCGWSLLGGFVHGMLPRSLPALVLAALLCLLTIPVGVAGHWWTLALALLPAGAMCAPTIASTGELISRAVPAAVRGEAMGMHASALTAGTALGAPLAGVVVDRFGPALGFAAVGVTGTIVLLAALGIAPVMRARTRKADLLS
jgi:predicted MFS family arabinose efflux permease